MAHRFTGRLLILDRKGRAGVNESTRVILRIDCCESEDRDISHHLAKELATSIRAQHHAVKVINRDLREGVSPVSPAWLAAENVSEEYRTGSQRSLLSESDALIAEMLAANDVIINMTVNQTGLPSSLKSWLDQIRRNALTYQANAAGKTTGLLENKRGFVIVISGQGQNRQDGEQAADYLRAALRQMGVVNVSIIDARRTDGNDATTIENVKAQIENILFRRDDKANAAE